MNQEKELVNRVAESGLLTIKLEDFFPEGEFTTFDLKNFLFMELILKEKDFREALKAHDWTQYQDKILLVTCSTDAIIPLWAYMLVAAYAQPYTRDIFQGDEDTYVRQAFQRALAQLDLQTFEGQRVVVKGCGEKQVPASAYLEITRLLRPLALSIMFGEPCSTVPVFKKPKITTSHSSSN